MSKRKPTPPPPSELPDFDELMSPSTAPPKEENNTRRKSDKSPKEQIDEQRKERLAVYLESDLLLRFEESHTKLKAITGLRGHKLSKSTLVDIALNLLINDVEANGENGVVANMLR